MESSRHNCTNCRWRDDEDGACHWNPPVVLGVENQFGAMDLDGYWPAVDELGWCGKWEEER
jgi:hypothetical protein